MRGQVVSEVSPSRRDFSQSVAASKEEPQAIARLRAAGLTREQLVQLATACDEAEVGALAGSLLGDLSPADLSAIAAASTAPIVRVDPLIDANQIYHSRLHGADAVVLPAEVLDPATLARLVDVAASMHMAVIVECAGPGAVKAALRWPHTVIGFCDRAVAVSLSSQVPASRTVVLLEDAGAQDLREAMRGICDAVMVAAATARRGR